MNVPVWVEQKNGTFMASVPGVPSIHSNCATRELAVDAVRLQLQTGMANGRLVLVDLDFTGVSGLAGKYKNDPTLLDICAEAYRLRDEEKAAEMDEYDRP